MSINGKALAEDGLVIFDRGTSRPRRRPFVPWDLVQLLALHHERPSRGRRVRLLVESERRLERRPADALANGDDLIARSEDLDECTLHGISNDA